MESYHILFYPLIFICPFTFGLVQKKKISLLIIPLFSVVINTIHQVPTLLYHAEKYNLIKANG